MSKGSAREALNYFRDRLNLVVPEFCNPSTFFMKCMNPEGFLVQQMQVSKNYNLKIDENIHHDFEERMKFMIQTYKNSELYKDLIPNLNEPIPSDKTGNCSWISQFLAILIRAYKNEIRNAMDVRMKIGSSLFFSAVCIIVFEGVITI